MMHIMILNDYMYFIYT